MKITEKTLIFPIEKRVTNSCHASTVCAADNGDILAAWFGGEHEKADDVEIYLSRRDKSSGIWTEPRMISVKDNVACWNPVLFKIDGKIVLCYKKGSTIPEWKTLVRYSYDDGYTWTEPVELVDGDRSGGRGPVKNKPLILSDGTVIAGASHETSDRESVWRAFIDISRDGCATWERGQYLCDGEKIKLIQPALWCDDNGIHALMRSKNGKIFRSDADKEKLIFSDAYPIDVPSNNSGIDLDSSPDGRIFLICNPVDTGDRSPISLLVSENGGDSFEYAFDIMKEDGGELSYPAVLYNNGELLVTFTYNRISVMFVRIEI